MTVGSSELEKGRQLSSGSLTRAEARIRDRMSQGKSPADIARELSADERFGYTPEQVYAVINKILSSLDAYTLDQQLKLTILDLRELAAMAKENYELTGRGEHLRGAVEALDKSAVHIEALQAKSEELLVSLDRENASRLVRLMERTFDRAVGELSARFPGLEREELESVFVGHLHAVAREEDERQEKSLVLGAK